MMRNIAFVVLLVVLSIGLMAQEKPQTQFRTNVNFVEIPVRVVDSRGRPVMGLTVSDFEVLEDGVRQNIATFDAIQLSQSQTRPRPAPRTESSHAEPGSAPSSNASRDLTRVYVLLIDDYHLPMLSSTQAKRIATNFVENHLAPTDVAAVVYASGIKGQDLTSDRSLLLAAIERVRGTLDYLEPASVREQKARSVLRTIRDVSLGLVKFGRGRKGLIYFGPAVGCRMSYDAFRDTAGPKVESGNERALGNLSSAGTGAPPDASAILLCNDAITDTVRDAARADLTVYSIDPRGAHNPDWVSPAVDGRGGPDRARVRNSMVDAGKTSQLDGFYAVAEQTGGFAVAGTNGFSGAFDRIVEHNSTYYLIGYYSTADAAAGRFRRHQVSVQRPGLRTEHRPGYYGPP